MKKSIRTLIILLVGVFFSISILFDNKYLKLDTSIISNEIVEEDLISENDIKALLPPLDDGEEGDNNGTHNQNNENDIMALLPPLDDGKEGDNNGTHCQNNETNIN